MNLWLILDMSLYTQKNKNIFVTYTQAEKITKCFGKVSIKVFLWQLAKLLYHSFFFSFHIKNIYGFL